MAQQTTNWWFAGYIADQFDSCRIEAHRYGDGLVFLGREDRLEFDIALQNLTAGSVDAYVFAEIAEAIGIPAGVINVVTADREVSELLVTDPRVDKITFTGSTAAGRRIASICGERIARCTLALGGQFARG